MPDITRTQANAVYGDTPVPWAPWSQLEPARQNARLLAELAAVDFVRHIDRGDAFDREYAVRKVAEYDAFRAAIEAREAAILAVVA